MSFNSPILFTFTFKLDYVLLNAGSTCLRNRELPNDVLAV